MSQAAYRIVMSLACVPVGAIVGIMVQAISTATITGHGALIGAGIAVIFGLAFPRRAEAALRFITLIWH